MDGNYKRESLFCNLRCYRFLSDKKKASFGHNLLLERVQHRASDHLLRDKWDIFDHFHEQRALRIMRFWMSVPSSARLSFSRQLINSHGDFQAGPTSSKSRFALIFCTGSCFEACSVFFYFSGGIRLFSALDKALLAGIEAHAAGGTKKTEQPSK